MEFWGIEVQTGQLVDEKIGEDRCLVIRQACVAGSNEEVEEFIIVKAFDEDKEIELATLHPNKQPQQEVAEMFRKNLTFSHTYKNGSVYLLGNYLDKKRMIYDVFDEEQETPNSLDDVDEILDVDEEQETPNSLDDVDKIPDDFDEAQKNGKYLHDLDRLLILFGDSDEEEETPKNGGGSMFYNRMFKTKTLPAIAVGVVCLAASCVMIHQRK